MFAKFYKYCLLCGIIIFSAGTYVSAEINNEQASNAEPVIAVLQFANYSGSSKAPAAVMHQIYKQLEQHHLKYVPQADLRSVLRKYRIRSIGSVNRRDVLNIKKSTIINRIILGSINIYESQKNPEISISIRIIDTDQLSIITAGTISATGSDFEKMFGLNKIGSVELLLEKVVDDLFSNLVEKLKNYNNLSIDNNVSHIVAIVPFDNISEKKYAGLITSNILLSNLIRKGFKVIEPGIIKEYMLRNKRVLRGEIDLKTLEQFNTELNIDLLITGSVEHFKLARSIRQPELEIGARALDADNGRIIIMFNDSRKGNDSETIFGFGKINSMGNLIAKSFDKYLHKLESKSEKYFAKRN